VENQKSKYCSSVYVGSICICHHESIQICSVIGTTGPNRVRARKAITEGDTIDVPGIINLCLCRSSARLECLAIQVTHLSQSLVTLVDDEGVEVVAQHRLAVPGSELGIRGKGITSCRASGSGEGCTIVVELPGQSWVCRRAVGGRRYYHAVAIVGNRLVVRDRSNGVVDVT
jgi:hypothetical protein